MVISHIHVRKIIFLFSNYLLLSIVMEWFAVCDVVGLLCLCWGNIVVFFVYMLSSRTTISSAFDLIGK